MAHVLGYIDDHEHDHRARGAPILLHHNNFPMNLIHEGNGAGVAGGAGAGVMAGGATGLGLSTIPIRKARTVVHVENANKVYGRGENERHVLKNLCMTVEEHTIYGLLGASGCGKTTILSCIVALRKLDSGSILVCGEPTGSPRSGIPGKKVGYMPQEIAMNGEFTIDEVLAFFGRIYGMSARDIRLRTQSLVALLDLNGLEQRIDDLSDGQKRRVSMAVALIHQPDLLILDEPTVGLDPLLRDSIWVYLHNLVAKTSTTIIVTTHYIEEMRQAGRVGIMRSGHLLCEDSPSNLLRIYNENLLDTVVVKLCKQDEGPSSQGGVLGPFAMGGGGGGGGGVGGAMSGEVIRPPGGVGAHAQPPPHG